MTTMTEIHQHVFNPAKRGNYEVCSCGERFPCAEKDCGHIGCWEARGTLPTCHFCGEKLKGEHNTETATWGAMNIRNRTRAAHYCCRDANGTTPRKDIICRAHGPNAYFPEPCEHEFEGKEPMDIAMLKQLAKDYRAE